MGQRSAMSQAGKQKIATPTGILSSTIMCWHLSGLGNSL
jgi:hypothetical protein